MTPSPEGSSLFRATSPASRSSDRDSTSHNDLPHQQHSHQVRSRLYALFSHPQQPEAGPSRPKPSIPAVRRKTITRHDDVYASTPSGDAYASLGAEIHKSSTEPIIRLPEPKDRDAIKVFVCTWNMGDALPKGDLSVLLGGPIPQYKPPDPDDPDAFGTNGLPRLPVADAHPYHIVVVAGQECPTDSKVPRGLGGGIMKGMSVRGGRKEREREAKEAAQKEMKDGVRASKEDDQPLTAGLDRLDIDVLDDEADRSRGGSPMPTTPGPHSPALHHRHKGANAGWSGLLDEWFCGVSAQSRHHVLGANSPTIRDSATVPAPSPQALVRSASASFAEVDTPNGASHAHTAISRPEGMPSLNLPAPGHKYADHLGVPSFAHEHVRAHSPLSMDQSYTSSPESGRSSSSSLTPVPSAAVNDKLLPPVPPPKAASVPASTKLGNEGGIDRPATQTGERTGLPIGSGSYLHLAKERLMGMYLSVYVYKGCEHLVEGVDKDYVTAGLAGGRLGNKGGIGISLKIAGHSMLFVNAHLTAHTGRNAARLANIAKIKSDLRLETFLPKDDPRNEASDLTDKFDTVFWCGDLNFRLDMSRLHAEWLVEQKKYQEALTWDQLKHVMADPKVNPFPGFEEGPIDFPPTFKYDVWRSVKATNRELRRSIKRRGSDARSIREGKEAAIGSTRSNGPLGHLVEELTEDDLESEEEACSNAPGNGRPSMESSATRPRTPSVAGTDRDDLSDASPNGRLSQSALNSAHNAHRPLDIAIKEKTKKFFHVVKLGVSGQSSSSLARRISLRRPSNRAESASPSKEADRPLASPEPPYRDLDQASRRTSLSSLLSSPDEQDLDRAAGQRTVPPLFIPGSTFQGSEQHGMLAASPMSIEAGSRHRSTSVASTTGMSSSPPHVPARRFGLKRTLSGKSFKGAASLDAEDDEVRGSLDLDEDNREGVYDTSKKQRVPSWCDRVLWKAHVIPDPEDHTSEHMARSESRKPFDRISAAFTNLGGHLRTSMARSGGADHAADLRRRSSFREFLSKDESPSVAPTLVASPVASPSDIIESEFPTMIEPRPTPPRQTSASSRHSLSLLIGRRSSLSRRSPTPGDSDSVSPRRHPLLDHRNSGGLSPTRAATASSTVKPKITFDEASSPTRDRRASHFNRPRANSDAHSHFSLGDILKPNMTRSPSFPPRIAIAKVPSADNAGNAGQPALSQPVVSNGEPLFGRRTRTISVTPSDQHPSKYLLDPRSIGADQTQQDSASNHDRSTFTRFLDSLPAWLHRSSVPPEHDLGPPVESPPLQPKRHRKGEVVCLHYGTIDDAGMRLLEGRSDHRPALFSAAVYI